jgi:hypothetical protein
VASTGFNHLEDIFKLKATTRLTPYSVVLSGATVGTVTAAAGVVTIPVASGTVLVDSHQFALSSGSVVTPALPDGVNVISVYVKPVRQVPSVSTLPGSGTEGAYVFLTTSVDENTEYLQDIYVYRAAKGGWILANQYLNYGEKDAIYAPNTNYFRSLPFSEITGTALSATDEKAILFAPSTGLPPELSNPGYAPAYARYSAGFKIADVTATLASGALTSAVVKRAKTADAPVT